jgi:hypothetical protein
MSVTDEGDEGTKCCSYSPRNKTVEMSQAYLVQLLRHFQRQLIYMYQHDPDDSKITWIVDEEGDKGILGLASILHVLQIL